jgi:hypothetical protein
MSVSKKLKKVRVGAKAEGSKKLSASRRMYEAKMRWEKGENTNDDIDDACRDMLGVYVVTKPSTVRSRADFLSDALHKLLAGELVTIVELLKNHKSERTRARLEDGGWISIENLCDGSRWAEPFTEAKVSESSSSGTTTSWQWQKSDTIENVEVLVQINTNVMPRREALKACEESNSFGDIIPLLRHEDPHVRVRALEHVCPCRNWHYSSEVWRVITGMASDPDLGVRKQVLHTLCDGSPEHLERDIMEAVEVFNRDPDRHTRRMAHKVMAEYRRTGKWNIM